ncbi:hypothetical protein [Croceitalea rosinachiae]|uniref:MFS transporter n=1 Tax=Croceitalea rosinachiae TaxID=3075596 RepID=A0ABU3A981_9FLAO|nr:hypothetical protein [Croceitalea sp. F388]MDT0605506.1 hypothetical protein [Croceitalea sp. F388]
MNTRKTTPQAFLKTLSILHLALLAGPLLAAIFFYLNTEVNINGASNEIFIYVFPVIGLAGIFASKFLYQQFLKPLKQHELLQTKLAGLQTASLIQYAVVEGPALLNIVWFGQTGNLLYLTIGAVLLIYLFILRPTKTKVETDLELKGAHKRQFDKLDESLP